MCGRFTYLFTWADLHRLSLLTVLPAGQLQRRYNVAPTQSAPVIRDDDGQRVGSMLQWGLVPHWAKDESIGSRLINARAESAADKPAFRAALRRRRCLVPASGFYEWSRPARRRTRSPTYFTPADEPLFTFAGLWESWTPADAGDPIETFCILTTDANDLVKEVHERMPVILFGPDRDRWLDRSLSEPGPLAPLLAPADPTRMRGVAVSPRVNSPRTDDPSLIEPIRGQTSLFEQE